MALYTEAELKNAQGVMYTKGLFYEVSTDPTTVIFTLKNDDHKGYRSLRKLYLEYCVDDPTEYNFAIAVFGDVAYWNKLKRSPILADYLPEWERTSTIERKSVAFSNLVGEVRKDGRNAFQAAKYLIEEPWKGRTKAAKEEAAQTSRDAFNPFKDDVSRMKEHWN